MTVTITGNDGVIFTFLDDEIESVGVEEVASPEQVANLGGGAADAYLSEIDGVLAVITITGTLLIASTTRTSSGTTTTILQQKQWLSKQLNGAQVPRAFTSDYESEMYSALEEDFVPTKIVVGRFSRRQETGGMDEMPFTIQLLVGTQ